MSNATNTESEILTTWQGDTFENYSHEGGVENSFLNQLSNESAIYEQIEPTLFTYEDMPEEEESKVDA